MLNPTQHSYLILGRLLFAPTHTARCPYVYCFRSSWEAIWAEEHQMYYYYNRATGASQWVSRFASRTSLLIVEWGKKAFHFWLSLAFVIAFLSHSAL